MIGGGAFGFFTVRGLACVEVVIVFEAAVVTCDDVLGLGTGVELDEATVGGGGTGVEMMGRGGAGVLTRLDGGPGMGVMGVFLIGSLIAGLNMTGV